MKKVSQPMIKRQTDKHRTPDSLNSQQVNVASIFRKNKSIYPSMPTAVVTESAVNILNTDS